MKGLVGKMGTRMRRGGGLCESKGSGNLERLAGYGYGSRVLVLLCEVMG